MRNLTLVFFLFVTTFSFSQKKPTIMVVPSDNWMFSNEYVDSISTSNGNYIKFADYTKAFREDKDILLVISKINSMMNERGFPLKDLENTLKSIQNYNIEDELLLDNLGGGAQSSLIDKLKSTANADIIIQYTYSINKIGPNKSLSFVLRGLDSYTNKEIAGSSGTGSQTYTAETPVLIEEALFAYLDDFNFQLQSYFDDILQNGRMVNLRIKTWESWYSDLESLDFGDDELSILIEDWVYENSVNGVYNLSISTSTQQNYEDIRIPLFYERNGRERPLSTRLWANNLKKWLKSNFNLDAKLMTRGLGQAQLVIGEN